MIKKLDLLIIRSFIGPFIVTFFIALFVLVMQFFWLYMDELIGKGLGILLILKLLFFMSAVLVPLALPLGILLASIMTFGNMGEHFELVAIKANGISLLRFLRPLFFVICGIGGIAFLFSNNIIPVANLKAYSLLYDLRNSKPTLNIRAGQFNRDIDGYIIRVGEKDKDGHTIRNVIIYDQTSGFGNDKVVLAEKGEMITPKDSRFMIFRLQNGWRYEDDAVQGGRNNYQQTRMHFKTWDKVFDLSAFKLSRTDEGLFKSAYQMMNVRQLNEGIDSLKMKEAKVIENVGSYLSPYLTFSMAGNESDSLRKKIKKATAKPLPVYRNNFLEMIPDSQLAKVTQFAISHVRNSKGLLDITTADAKIHAENVLKMNVEWHKKFTLSFACILLFLIGAPLGAIIRKGGLGMPLVIAIAFFIVFHILSISGEKLSLSNELSPLFGMWMATGMLLPIAFILINAARKDSDIFRKDWYAKIWLSIKSLFQKPAIA